MEKTIETGRLGECIAGEFLINNGFIIVGKNWRYKHLEIDIIAIKDLEIHFVEVKCLHFPCMQEPYMKVDKSKKKKIIKAANGFLNSSDWKSILKRLKVSCNFEACFDIVSIEINGEEHNLAFYENAYSPLW